MNLGAWNSIFAVPCSVVDEHIKLAGAAQLKVLLWFLRHAGENFCDEDMASALSMSPADARDSMQYWIATGIITIDKESGSIIPSVNETSAPFGFKLTEKPTFTAKIEPKAETLKAEITPVEQPIEKKQSEPKKPLPSDSIRPLPTDTLEFNPEEHRKLAERIFKKEFRRRAENIISAMYTPQKMNISEKAFQEQSLDGFSRLNKIQRELSEQFNMNPILTTRLSSEIISELTTESMKKLKQMEDED